MRMWTKLAIAGAMLVPFAGGVALAEAEPDEAIKYRKAVMQAIGGHTKASAAIITGKAGTAEDLKLHAPALYMSAMTALEAFRQNTHGQGAEKTTAAEAIWTDWAGFEGKMENLVVAARNLASAAEAGNAGGEQLKALGGTCKACHDDYRTK
ncbi:MAG: cytochrome c [Alphaproteobacteria bacterium]|nr:cytochrome c [Alphaproteobacteria bacterium]MDX5370383.1 cytochrome c [Alphaproteobacteria bacterium]MDX5464898.1 cytochrome c [Alphaproteobacteria bacterium]